MARVNRNFWLGDDDQPCVNCGSKEEVICNETLLLICGECGEVLRRTTPNRKSKGRVKKDFRLSEGWK